MLRRIVSCSLLHFSSYFELNLHAPSASVDSRNNPFSSRCSTAFCHSNDNWMMTISVTTPVARRLPWTFISTHAISLFTAGTREIKTRHHYGNYSNPLLQYASLKLARDPDPDVHQMVLYASGVVNCTAEHRTVSEVTVVIRHLVAAFDRL